MAITIKIKKLKEDAKVPSYAHPGDAAMDIFASETVELKPGEQAAISTGVAMEIPFGCVGLVWDKSGLAINNGLKTLGGVIDAGYRGEIKIGMINLSKNPYTLEKGNKVAQIIIQKREEAALEEVVELSDTARGEGGFGSTGK